MTKKLLNKILGHVGYKLHRTISDGDSRKLSSNRRLLSVEVPDLEMLAAISETIPGMITSNSGKFLYTLCYMQDLIGDVVEIGSWQGKSTSFLAQAVRDSNNGKLYAIDHFRGNKGKEDLYIVKKYDLSDLKDNFLKNMERLGVIKVVRLLDMPSKEAAKKLKKNSVRFLFIDGDHSKTGIEADIRHFFPKLLPGAIVVFDDFSEEFPELVLVLEELLSSVDYARAMSYNNTLVVKL